jgi:hypothetical protein
MYAIIISVSDTNVLQFKQFFDNLLPLENLVNMRVKIAKSVSLKISLFRAASICCNFRNLFVLSGLQACVAQCGAK